MSPATETMHTAGELARAAAKGSHDAFGVLTASYRDKAYRTARSRLRDHDAAEDVTQEAFTDLWLQLQEEESIEHLRVVPYLMGMIRRKCSSYYQDPIAGFKRRQYMPRRRRRANFAKGIARVTSDGRWEPVSGLVQEFVDPIEAAQAQAEERARAREVAEVLEAAEHQLTPKMKRVFFAWSEWVLSERGGGGYDVIARKLGISYRNVTVTLHTARRKLQTLFGRGKGAEPHPVVAEIDAWSSGHGLSRVQEAEILGYSKHAVNGWRSAHLMPSDPDGLRARMADYSAQDPATADA